jgi:hypothetical protein
LRLAAIDLTTRRDFPWLHQGQAAISATRDGNRSMANSERANPEKEKMISMHTFSSLYCDGPNNLPTVALAISRQFQ